MTTFMTNEFTGETKAVPAGFSWTTFFFGFFVPLFRGDMGWGAIMFIAGLFTWGFSNLLFAFFYNGLYRDKLLERGFRVAGGPSLHRFEPVPPPQIIQQVYVNTGPGGAYQTMPGVQSPFQPAPDPYAAPEREFYHEPVITPAPPPPPPAIENRHAPRPSFGRRGL